MKGFESSSSSEKRNESPTRDQREGSSKKLKLEKQLSGVQEATDKLSTLTVLHTSDRTISSSDQATRSVAMGEQPKSPSFLQLEKLVEQSQIESSEVKNWLELIDQKAQKTENFRKLAERYPLEQKKPGTENDPDRLISIPPEAMKRQLEAVEKSFNKDIGIIISDFAKECNELPKSEEKTTLTLRTNGMIRDLCISHIVSKAGYKGKILTEDFSYQKLDARSPGKRIVPELQDALYHQELGNLGDKGEGLFKLDSDALKQLHECLEQEPKDLFKSDMQGEYKELLLKNANESKEDSENTLMQLFGKDNFYKSGRGFSPKEAVDLLCKADQSGIVKFLMDQPLTLRKGEELTLREHTELVMIRLEIAHAQGWDTGEKGISLAGMRNALLVHDIAKTVANINEEQSLTNSAVNAELLGKMVPEDKADEAKVRYSVLKPEIGDLHKQNGGKWGERGVEPEAIAKKLAQTIVKLAEGAKKDPQVLLEPVSIYHMCDAGSYKSMVIYYPPEPFGPETKSVKTRPNEIMQRGIDQIKKAIEEEHTKVYSQQTSDAS